MCRIVKRKYRSKTGLIVRDRVNNFSRIFAAQQNHEIRSALMGIIVTGYVYERQLHNGRRLLLQQRERFIPDPAPCINLIRRNLHLKYALSLIQDPLPLPQTFSFRADWRHNVVGAVAVREAPSGTTQPQWNPFLYPQLTTEQKWNLLREQLAMILYAGRCQSPDSAIEGPILMLKRALLHIPSCQTGQECIVPYCWSSKVITTHWYRCTRIDCPLCLLPLPAVYDDYDYTLVSFHRRIRRTSS